jgi:hypothetical protein
VGGGWQPFVFHQKLLGEDAVPFSDPLWKSPQVMYTTPNKCVWKLPTSTQLRATWHTDSLDMVVLPSTGASHYHNCCIDGGTSPEYFGYHLVAVHEDAFNTLSGVSSLVQEKVCIPESLTNRVTSCEWPL